MWGIKKLGGTRRAPGTRKWKIFKKKFGKTCSITNVRDIWNARGGQKKKGDGIKRGGRGGGGGKDFREYQACGFGNPQPGFGGKRVAPSRNKRLNGGGGGHDGFLWEIQISGRKNTKNLRGCEQGNWEVNPSKMVGKRGGERA